MGKLLLASLVAGAIGALVVYFLLAANHRDETRTLTDRIATAEKLVEAFGGQLTEARKKVVESERKILAAARDAAMATAAADDAKAAAAAANAAVTGGASATDDGSPLLTANQVEALLDRRLGARGAARGEAIPAPPPVPIRTLSEVAAEMNLTSSEEALLRDGIKTMEEDMVKAVFGDRPIAEIAQEIREAKDDPDKQEALVNRVIGSGLANLGRFATYPTRKRKKVEEILGKDRSKEFLSKPIRPLIDVDLDDVLGD
jgi:hypothetical protein